MGNNYAWSIFEEQVIELYNQDKIDKVVLDCLAKPFAGTDIDSGGHHGLKAKDGKDMITIVVDAFYPDRVVVDKPKAVDGLDEYDVTWELVWEIRQKWGWR